MLVKLFPLLNWNLSGDNSELIGVYMADLNLIKSASANLEKRILPRFPLTLMTFRADQFEAHSFEVRDISFSGMQVALKTGNHGLTINDEISGVLMWAGQKLKIKGTVRWCDEHRVGLLFDSTNGLATEIKKFLSTDILASRMRPLHHGSFEMDLPSDLKYWLKSDGPAEIFIWQHRDGELSRFQFLLMDKLIEWVDGAGIRTGQVVKHNDADTPLSFKEEIDFHVDTEPCTDSLEMAYNIINKISEDSLPKEALSFLSIKLKAS